MAEVRIYKGGPERSPSRTDYKSYILAETA